MLDVQPRVQQVMVDQDDRRPVRDDRDSRRRNDRHEPPSAGRLNDYPMERPEHSDHRMPIQSTMRDVEPLPQTRRLPLEPQVRHPADEMPSSRAPPAGPRSNFDRRQQPPQKELFTGGGPPTRPIPGGPIHPSEQLQFREPRHPPAGSYHHQDPNHGRLNPPEPVIPKGPRERNAPFIPRGGPPGGVGGGISGNGGSGGGGSGTGSINIRGQAPTVSSAPPSAPAPAPRPLPSPVTERKIEMPPPVVGSGGPPAPAVDTTTNIHPDRMRTITSMSDPGPEPAPVQAAAPPPVPQSGPASPGPKPSSPPTGPARREDEQRNNRRRILNVQSHLAGESEARSDVRGRGGRRTTGSAATTPTASR